MSATYILHHGDYRETLALCDGKADLVFTSPPYADARTYGMGCNWTMDDYAALGDAVFAALRPGGHALVNVDAPVREWRPGFGTERGFHPWRMMLDWAERVGFRVPDRLAFGRDGFPGKFAGFRNDWEPLLWFVKPGGVPFTPDTKCIGTPTNPKNRRERSNAGRMKDGTRSIKTASPFPSTRSRGNLWLYGSVGGGQTGALDIEAQNHPARWPYKLAEDIVRCFCPPGGLACDPFVGAGTSAAAAVEHGRRFIGGDLGSRAYDPTRPHLDAVPWVTVTERVLRERAKQAKLFAVG